MTFITPWVIESECCLLDIKLLTVGLENLQTVVRITWTGGHFRKIWGSLDNKSPTFPEESYAKSTSWLQMMEMDLGLLWLPEAFRTKKCLLWETITGTKLWKARCLICEMSKICSRLLEVPALRVFIVKTMLCHFCKRSL